MVSDILGTKTVTFEQLTVANNGVAIYLKQWRAIKCRLILKDTDALHLKSNPQLRIPYINQWVEVITNAHMASSHLGLKSLKTLMHWFSSIVSFKSKLGFRTISSIDMIFEKQ